MINTLRISNVQLCPQDHQLPSETSSTGHPDESTDTQHANGPKHGNRSEREVPKCVPDLPNEDAETVSSGRFIFGSEGKNRRGNSSGAPLFLLFFSFGAVWALSNELLIISVTFCRWRLSDLLYLFSDFSRNNSRQLIYSQLGSVVCLYVLGCNVETVRFVHFTQLRSN